MTTYLDTLKTSLSTQIEQSFGKESSGFDNEAPKAFLATLSTINNLADLKGALTALSTKLIDGYLYSHPLKTVLNSISLQITPEAIAAEKGNLQEIEELRKKLEIAKKVIETKDKDHKTEVRQLRVELMLFKPAEAAPAYNQNPADTLANKPAHTKQPKARHI